jgi:4-hydroxy-tetrahydrodipicolinate synthase
VNLEEAKHNLTGPVMSLRTPFDQDGEIDYDGVKSIIDSSITGGSRTIMLTAGDSHYDCLSDEEIAELTKSTCDHVRDRAMVIAADRRCSTARAVQFARFCKDAGADMYMAMPPDWGHSCTPSSLAEHYKAVADILPLMIVTNVFIPHGRDFCLETIERTLELSDNVLAIKDDMCGNVAHDISGRFHDRLAIIAGGQKRNHMNMLPWGVDGYLSTFVNLNPAISQAYWNGITSGNLPAAVKVMMEQDIPFFDFVVSMTGGFDAAMHGMLELYGLAGRWRRKPYHTIEDEELNKLAEFLKSKKML